MPSAPCYASTQSDHSATITPPSPYTADTVHADDDQRCLWLWTHNNWSSSGNRSREASEATCHVILDPWAAEWRCRRQPESSGTAGAEKQTARRRNRMYRSGMYRSSTVPIWTCTEVGQNGSTTSVHIILCTEMVCTEMDMYRTGSTPVGLYK